MPPYDDVPGDRQTVLRRAAGAILLNGVVWFVIGLGPPAAVWLNGRRAAIPAEPVAVVLLVTTGATFTALAQGVLRSWYPAVAAAVTLAWVQAAATIGMSVLAFTEPGGPGPPPFCCVVFGGPVLSLWTVHHATAALSAVRERQVDGRRGFEVLPVNPSSPTAIGGVNHVRPGDEPNRG